MINIVNTDPFLVFFGSFYLVLGLSVFFANKAWSDFIKLYAQNDAVSLISGIITLPIALFIVVFYEGWDTGIAAKILVVIGYLALLKALVLLLKPDWIRKLVQNDKMIKPLWLRGLIAAGVGVALIVL